MLCRIESALPDSHGSVFVYSNTAFVKAAQQKWGEVIGLMELCKEADPSNGVWWLVTGYAMSEVAKKMPEESRRSPPPPSIDGVLVVFLSYFPLFFLH